MNTLNFTAAKPTRGHLRRGPSLNPNRLPFCKPLSSTSVRFPPPPLPRISATPCKASLQNESREKANEPLKLFKFKSTNQNAAPAISLISFLAPLKTTLVATITAAALLFSGFYFSRKPSIASPMSAPPTTETAEKDSIPDEEREKLIEEHLLSNPNDVDGLKNLVEIKIKSKKVPEAIEILDKLIKLEPQEVEWPMMKGHLYAYNGEPDLGKNMFNKLLKKDPLRVEAYHGLVSEASQEELQDIERRIEDAMKLCKKENKKSELRDFTLLIAQIRVLEGRYYEALKVYEGLAEEEPRDFRPYLCQGIIYTLLSKNNEAEKNFEKYRRLVPKGHPYGGYFDDNMIATKIFAQKAEKERAMTKR